MTNEKGNSSASGSGHSAKLVRGSVAFHTVNQTYPLVVGVAAIMSIGIVDAYYVGKLGPAPLAAMSFVFPVTTALSSIGVGVMVGIASVVSRALGGGDRERASALANLGFLLALGVGLLLGGALWTFDRAGLAFAQSVARVVLIMLPVAALLKPAWGADAVYAAELAANVLGALVAAAAACFVF